MILVLYILVAHDLSRGLQHIKIEIHDFNRGTMQEIILQLF